MLRLGSQANHRGMALVIAILVLFVLTVLGLALMLTTSTEAGIGANYRWGEQAFFHADAGLEFAKNVLAEYVQKDGDLRNVLPPVRTDMAALPGGGVGRDYQYSLDQGGVKLHIGRVLLENGPSGRRLEFNFENPGANGSLKGGQLESTGDKQDLQGTVTIWVRRPLLNGKDDPDNRKVIVTAEGTAPNFMQVGTGQWGAMRRLETLLQLQSGNGPGGVGRNRYGQESDNSDPLVGSPTITQGTGGAVKYQ